MNEWIYRFIAPNEYHSLGWFRSEAKTVYPDSDIHSKEHQSGFHVHPYTEEQLVSVVALVVAVVVAIVDEMMMK